MNEKKKKKYTDFMRWTEQTGPDKQDYQQTTQDTTQKTRPTEQNPTWKMGA